MQEIHKIDADIGMLMCKVGEFTGTENAESEIPIHHIIVNRKEDSSEIIESTKMAEADEIPK